MELKSVVEAEPKIEKGSIGIDDYREKEKSFANGLNFYKVFWIFFVSCVLGFVIETIWCLVVKGKLDNRQGLIYGPFSQVYGFGAVLLTLALHKLPKKNDIFLFIGSMVIGAFFEYMCSLIQQFAFGTVSWDYSETQFNFNGRTNLMYACYWGILGVLMVKVIYPWFSRLIEKIPNNPGLGLTWILIIFMAFDLAISGLAVYRQSERKKGIPAGNVIEQFIDNHYTDEYLKKVYPNMIQVG